MRRFLVLLAVAGATAYGLVSLSSGDPAAIMFAGLLLVLGLAVGVAYERTRRAGVDLRATKRAVPGLRRTRLLNFGTLVRLALITAFAIYLGVKAQGGA